MAVLGISTVQFTPVQILLQESTCEIQRERESFREFLALSSPR
jgi:hypothetical protein